MPEDDEGMKGEAITPPIILLDNNILQCFLDKSISPHLQNILEEVEQGGATLAVSDIVLYESLKAIAFNTVKSSAVTDFINKYLTRYLVDDNVLTQAARVHEIYGSDNETKQRRSGFSTEDIIIGTTSMILGAFVLTSDCNDFPMPFFKENNREIIYYNIGNKRKHTVIYLLEPDNDVIAAALAGLTPQVATSRKPRKSSNTDKKSK